MTIIFTADFEDQTIGNHPTNPPVYPGYADAAGKLWPHIRGSETGTPVDGTKFLEYYIAASQTDAGSQIQTETINGGNPYLFTNGNTYYFCWFQRFNRVDGVDIWDTTHDEVQSGDKGVEVFSTAQGIRWCVGQGMWDGYQALGAGKWTVWIGNPSFHLNDGDPGPDLEGGAGSDAIAQNANGYSTVNPYLLDYERWYAFIFMMKLETWGGGTRDINGQIQLYINGTKIADHNNICTSNDSTPGFEFIEVNGTIRQPAYNCPAHYRWWDGFLVTDNASNEINAYMLDPESGSSERPPSAPNNIRISTLSLRRLHPKI